MRKVHLTSVRVPCRCRLRHVVCEVRCRACAEIVILEASAAGFVVMGPGHAIDTALHRDEVAVDEVAVAIERRLERDR